MKPAARLIFAVWAATVVAALPLYAGDSDASKADAYAKAAKDTPALNSAKRLEKKGKWKKAEAEYKKALEAAPEHPDAYDALVAFYDGRKRLDDGVEYFTAMLESHPDRLICHLALMKLYKLKKEPDKAREQFMKVLEKKDPEFLKQLLEKEKNPAPKETPAEGASP